MRSRQTVPRILVGAAVGLMLMSTPLFAREDQPRAPAKAPAQESGDPTKLKPEEMRTIWDVLATIQAPGKVQTRFVNGLDLYVSLRQAELAQDLGIRAWTVDFEAGPFVCWLEIDQEGKKTRRMPELPGVNWVSAAEKGRLLLWFLPGVSETNPSERSRQILKRLKTADRSASPIPEVFGLQVIGGPNVVWELTDIGLWSTWNDVSIKEVSRPTPAKVNGEVTLLEIEATEKRPAEGAQPRKLKLTLKAKPKSKRP